MWARWRPPPMRPSLTAIPFAPRPLIVRGALVVVSFSSGERKIPPKGVLCRLRACTCPTYWAPIWCRFPGGKPKAPAPRARGYVTLSVYFWMLQINTADIRLILFLKIFFIFLKHNGYFLWLMQCLRSEPIWNLLLLNIMNDHILMLSEILTYFFGFRQWVYLGSSSFLYAEKSAQLSIW